jgi:orotidine-5'-phosphate decarboxylase
MFDIPYGIILACDVSDVADARTLAKISVGVKEVVGFKVGFDLALGFGLPRVTEILKEINALPVIYDHQKAATDIPEMGERFARRCKDSGVDAVIIFPQAGPKTLDAFISSIIGFGMVPIVGGVMTHRGYLVSDGGYIIDEAPTRIFEIALKKGVRDFVLPGNKPELIGAYKAVLGTQVGVSALMPGIGTQGGDLETAFKACAGLRPYAIIGSAIYRADSPLEQLRLFAAAARTSVNRP